MEYRIKNEDILEIIKNICVHIDNYKNRYLYTDKDLFDIDLYNMELDSLDIMEVSLEIESKFRVVIEDDYSLSAMTIKEITDMVNEKLEKEEK